MYIYTNDFHIYQPCCLRQYVVSWYEYTYVIAIKLYIKDKLTVISDLPLPKNFNVLCRGISVKFDASQRKSVYILHIPNGYQPSRIHAWGLLQY